jgi:hypothetical protein
VMNFPMQANGAEMLRLACCLAIERGLAVCAPVHDAILIEAPLAEMTSMWPRCRRACGRRAGWCWLGWSWAARPRSLAQPIHGQARRADVGHGHPPAGWLGRVRRASGVYWMRLNHASGLSAPIVPPLCLIRRLTAPRRQRRARIPNQRVRRVPSSPGRDRVKSAGFAMPLLTRVSGAGCLACSEIGRGRPISTRGGDVFGIAPNATGLR